MKQQCEIGKIFLGQERLSVYRGMYEVSQTHSEMGGDKSPWTWITVGQWVAFFALQAVGNYIHIQHSRTLNADFPHFFLGGLWVWFVRWPSLWNSTTWWHWSNQRYCRNYSQLSNHILLKEESKLLHCSLAVKLASRALSLTYLFEYLYQVLSREFVSQLLVTIMTWCSTRPCCAVYMLLTILVEEGWFELLGYQIRRLLSPFLSCIPGFRNSDTQSNQEDDDVARERYRIQDGTFLYFIISPNVIPKSFETLGN